MNSRSLPRWLTALQKICWVLLLLTLPVTSFPYFPTGFGGGTLVRPLSLYPLVVLILILVIPRLLREPVPRTVLAIVPFVIVITASAAVAMLRDIEPALGISVFDRTLRGLVTLAVGVAFYWAVAIYPRSYDDLRVALRWLYVGFSVAMTWGLFQSIYIIHYIPSYFRTFNRLQGFISIRKLFQTRISGMTYEPNWFAEQISILVLPWLIASILSDYSVFPWRWRRLTVEWLLLPLSLLNLAFTFSRAGFLNLIVLSVAGFLLYQLQRAHTDRQNRRPHWWLTRLMQVTLLLALVIGSIFFVGQNNTFFSRLWNFWSERNDTSLAGYIEYIGFGARVAYIETALNIFEDYPLLGVGPGNYAFYFDEYLADRPLAPTPELLRILTPDTGRNRLITPKNLYVRTLAEAGLVGIAALIAFLVAILGAALYLWFSPQPQERFWGMAALLTWLVVLVSANSFDSFALPNLWVAFGFISAAANISDRNYHNSLASITQ